jgi:nucleotide-binding universal stress UspA family protein
MAYRTMLTIATQGTLTLGDAPLDVAVALARLHGAHLETLSLGIDQTQVGYFYAGASAIVYQETLERAQAEAEKVDSALRARLGREDILWSSDRAVAQLGGIAGLVAQRARFADLVILPKPYGPGRGPAEEAILEAALFDGQAPVLVMPDGRSDPPKLDRIVAAWNQAPEALVAVRRALPLLKQAKFVDITIIDPPVHGAERSDPGGMLSQFLARHGVRADVTVLARTLPSVVEVLNRHATDIEADLVVMGAYGHSRFREAILGGATRDMLEQAKVPVFMAH